MEAVIPPILMYHRIGHRPGDKNTVSPERFELQLQYLEDHGYQSIGLTEWHRKVMAGEKISEKSVILTFDDGYRDNWELAMPLLSRYGFSATVFMVSDLVGGTNLWERNESRQNAEMMKLEHLREWLDAGFEVGSHGVSHRRVTTLNPEELEEEVTKSKKDLEDLLGVDIKFFCYPNGNFNAAAVEALKKAGYLGSVAIYEGASWQEPVEWFALPRLRVSDQDEPGIFRWKVSKYHSWLGRARQFEKKIKGIFR